MVAEPTTFGIEEEFVFLDPVTMKPVDVAAGAFETLSARPAWAPITHREFLASQVEHASTVFTSSAAALASLVGFRHELAEEARRHDQALERELPEAGQPVLDVGDPEPVLERLVRVAVGDAARVTVRPQEAEPDRQLAK